MMLMLVFALPYPVGLHKPSSPKVLISDGEADTSVVVQEGLEPGWECRNTPEN